MDSWLRNLIGRRIRLTNTDHPNLNYGDVGTIIDIQRMASGDPVVWVDWDKAPTRPLITRTLISPSDMFEFVD